MNKTDYREFYRLNPSIRKGSKVIQNPNDSSSLCKLVDSMMGFTVEDSVFRIRRRKDDEKVRFSKDKYNDMASEILVLSEHRKKRKIFTSAIKTIPIVALRYQAVSGSNLNQLYNMKWDDDPDWKWDPENYLGICYVQTLTKIKRTAYQKVAEKLGSRPHEFMVAQFLARIAPVLNIRPQTKVILQEARSSSRKTIRDRFFDKQWRLNPNKERVRQILGEDNAWLDPRTIRARKVIG
jgi:hypothetical protein